MATDGSDIVVVPLLAEVPTCNPSRKISIVRRTMHGSVEPYSLLGITPHIFGINPEYIHTVC